MRAIVASPLLAYRQVLAALARDAGLEPTVIGLSNDAMADLARPSGARLLILHHPDDEVAASLARYAKDRNLTVIAIVDQPQQRRTLHGTCALALPGSSNWSAVVDAIRKLLRPAAAVAV